MAKAGRIEARLTLTEQEFTYTDSNGGPATITIAAGNYFPTDLMNEVTTQVQAAAGSIGAGFFCDISRGESSATGRTTMFVSSGTFSITWGSATDLRDALGFTSDISSVATVTGPDHARGMWLPGNPAKFSMYGDSANGSIETDLRTTVSPNGYVNTLYGSKRRSHRNVSWTGVPNTRALQHFENVANESFESFFLDAATGRVSYIPVGAYVRIYWDADNDATYSGAEGRLLWPADWDLDQHVQGWVGRFRVALPPLVIQS